MSIIVHSALYIPLYIVMYRIVLFCILLICILVCVDELQYMYYVSIAMGLSIGNV